MDVSQKLTRADELCPTSEEILTKVLYHSDTDCVTTVARIQVKQYLPWFVKLWFDF